MDHKPLVSVLMTAYNREKYIAEAIESVIASTYQNWELIVVDDQSKDRTVEIAKSYEAKDNRIKVYINEVNLGDYPNRNKAASYAKGKYLKYLDSDDIIYSHGLEVMVNAMEQYTEAALGINWHKSEMRKAFPVIFNSEQVFKQQFMGNGFFFTGPTGTIIKRSAFEELKGLSEMRYTGDFDSWLKFSSKYSVVVFQPSLIWWRQHEGQEFQLGSELSKYLKSTTEISLKYIMDSCSPFKPNDRKLALTCLKQRHARMFLTYILKLRFQYAFKYFRYSNINFCDITKGIRKSQILFNIEEL